MKVKEINIENEFYPEQLKNIINPPQKLYVLGNEKILNNECLSIVGSRCCTPYGVEIARNFSRDLAKKRSNNS